MKEIYDSYPEHPPQKLWANTNDSGYDLELIPAGFRYADTLYRVLIGDGSVTPDDARGTFAARNIRMHAD